jgi:pyruvate,orthophosphate dikinase
MRQLKPGRGIALARNREVRVMTKWVYTFGDGQAEGSAADRNLLGGKGANLAEMCNLGLPVPPGLTITTEACVWYYENGRKMPDGLEKAVTDALVQVGEIAGRRFGDPEKPLLLSVRSGARASMPGMMDTVLNLGLNDDTVAAVARASGDERFAWTATAASSRCMPMWSWVLTTRFSRKSSRMRRRARP